MTCDANTYPFLGYFCIEKNINISTVVTISLFLLGYVLAKLIERNSQKKVRRKSLVALLQEIEVNVESLKTTFDQLPSPADLDVFIRKGYPETHNRPLITVAHIYAVFNANTEILKDLDYILIKLIIQFYGRLDNIKTDVGAIEYKAFETISLEGRNALFAHVRTSMELGIAEGKNARDGISLYLRIAR